MKLEDQVCSLDLAKRLKELGVKQESLFYFSSDTYGSHIVWSPILKDVDPLDGDIPAFTVAELGEMLPECVTSERFKTYNEKDTGRWCSEYSTNDKTKELWAPTEADARAKMLIYLKENELA